MEPHSRRGRAARRRRGVAHDTPAAAAAGRELVVTMLTDGRAVEDALFGPTARPPRSARGRWSPTPPRSARTPRAASGGGWPDGVGYVDAPVVGSVPQAEAGGLEVLAGGDAPDEDRLRGRPVGVRAGPPGGSGRDGRGAEAGRERGARRELRRARGGPRGGGRARRRRVRGALDVLGIGSPQARRVREARADATPRFTLALAGKDLDLAVGAARPPAGGLLAAAHRRTAAALAAASATAT
ncbi:hypothetical protein BJF79_25195 [Actinomadura sp. CNU-125]|nr:NAD(P)-binding domain-containing protein [Actinomadura sp. CNU-125]OLT10956.1 hypothetical protein BJF79_25195 [Actinomadura sp. CNU-125]